MTKVWSIKLGLVLSKMEKQVDKSAILKAIEDSRAYRAFQSKSPWMSSRVPKLKSK